MRMNPPPPTMRQSQYQPMMNNMRYGGGWSRQQPSMSLDPNNKVRFQNQKYNFQSRNNWNYRKGCGGKRRDQRRMEKPLGNGKKFYPKKKFSNRFAPYAPRNTSSFIIRAKKSGGIASLVSPFPATPAVLPTPSFSPSREVLGDMAKEEWGVDGYGSMKGLIRLRSPECESDLDEHVEVERRLDHDLSRFQTSHGGEYSNVLEIRVDGQDTHIAQLEEENLTLKARLFLMERGLADLRTRMHYLEMKNHVWEDLNEEVVDNGSENDGEEVSRVRVAADHNTEEMEYVSANFKGRNDNVDVKVEYNYGLPDFEDLRDVYMEELKGEELGGKLEGNDVVAKDDYLKDEEAGDKLVAEEGIVANENGLKDEEARNQFVTKDVADA